MYQRSIYNSRTSRPRSFGGGRSSGNRSKGNHKQSIPAHRFIKPAKPVTMEAYVPMHQFADFDVHPKLKENITAKGFESPSHIQDMAIPHALEGKDVVGIANTGTGKTAAFMIPIINTLVNFPNGRALIMAPTRELAQQIEVAARELAKGSGLFGTVLIGGAPMGKQLQDLRQQPEIVIGTPGRIKDHTERGSLNLNTFTIAVLDEVDRMVDMGFINDMRYLLGQLPADRQSLFFSATMSPEVQGLIHGFSEDPVIISVKTGETSDNVEQAVVSYREKGEKMDKLHDVLLSSEVKKTLIFGETKHGVEKLSKELSLRGFKADALHGGKSQGQRQRALDNFRRSHIDILVATDVAARGIDVADITHVINFDTPNTYEDYVHRIGRAGRAGRTGFAYTFVEQ
jgi:ATP-dependent RNA helicase RhlE